MRRDDLSLPEPPATDRPGDRWVCGGSQDGTACAQGPSPLGVCPLANQCRPRRTWHGRRRQIAVVSISMATLSLFGLLVYHHGRAAVFRPGELTVAHAQILAGKHDSQRCAVCHPAAATSPTEWFSSEIAAHQHPNLSQRCLQCHHTTIDRSAATLAHNLSRHQRVQIEAVSRRADPQRSRERTWHDLLPGPAVDSEHIQCNACHREHRGPQHDLTHMSNAQCQTCHQDRFGNFADSHPEWQQWPYGGDHRIAFDHATHAGRHFPATQINGKSASFRCDACHRRDEADEITRWTSYEAACQSCHDKSLRLETDNGIDLLTLPTIPPTSSDELGRWPRAAVGFYDGTIAPMTRLLMRGQADWTEATRRIPDGDFSRIDVDDDAAVDAAEQTARLHRELLSRIGRVGQSEIVQRTERAGIAGLAVRRFVRSLPPQLIEQAVQQWFGPEPSTEARLQRFSADVLAKPDELDLLEGESDDDLLLDSELASGDDPLSPSTALEDPTDDVTPPATTSDERRRFDPEQMIPHGGWYRDDQVLAIRYRGSGHEDPVIRAAIEMISELPADDPDRQRLLRTRAVAACIACHPGALGSPPQWTNARANADDHGFTKFRHAPHLNIATLIDCAPCHRVRRLDDSSEAMQLAGYLAEVEESVSPTGGAATHDFEPLTRDDCAGCHTQRAAGESCTKCHRYHVDLR